MRRAFAGGTVAMTLVVVGCDNQTRPVYEQVGGASPSTSVTSTGDGGAGGQAGATAAGGAGQGGAGGAAGMNQAGGGGQGG